MTPTRPNGGAIGLMRPQGRESAAAAPVAVALWRVRVVIPCFNRRKDAELLLGDLAGLDLGGRVRLDVLLVDNASDEPLEGLAGPVGLAVEHLRLGANSGGSGGFNAGMARVLSRGVPGDRTELIWLLDSDARVEPGTLLPLVAALEADDRIAAAGSTLVDPGTGKAFECGGWVNPANGELEQPLAPGWERQAAIPAQYLAACSLLVRREAVERTGLMADLFVSGDDVEWCLRMARRTGAGVVGVPASRARHPNPDKMRTWARYYSARNAFTVMAAAGVTGRLARLRRALRATGRALAQAMVGRDDLAELHLRGLADARAGIRGKAPGGTIAIEGWGRLDAMPAALRRMLAEGTPRGRVVIRPNLLPDQLATEKALNAACVATIVEQGPGRGTAGGLIGALRSLVLGPPWGVAVVSARARPADWLAARVIVSVEPEAGFVIRRLHRWDRAVKLASIAGRGVWASLQLARRGGARNPVGGPALVQGIAAQPSRPTVGVVVLSFNRWPALEATLRALESDPDLSGAPVIVADNGSADGTPERLKTQFPRVKPLALGQNRGVAAFNRAAEQAGTDTLLILDDDARPEPGAVGAALDLLARRPDLGAVALHPRHPQTRQSEWPFGQGSTPHDDWPVMGCANLVRAHAWARVGGYEEAFFLYRNDTDLAMKLLEAGFGVHFDPAWIVWHDSPAAAAKSARWLDLATRNWVWLCRRHGRGLSELVAAVLGWLWAHRLAGWSVVRQWSALKGFAGGWIRRPPPLPQGLLVDGTPVRRLLRLRLRG